MTQSFADLISRATRLTRSGNLQDATAAIQSALKSDSPVVPSTDDAIEGTFTRLNRPATAPRREPPQRTTLAETLRKVAAGGMPVSNKVRVTDGTLPQGAEFLSLTHDGALGSRTYRLYLPATRTAQMPLVIMLHGCTQTPEDFAVGTGMNALAEAFGCIIAYPGQAVGANAQKCWNWYRPEDQAGGAGEPAIIAGVTRDIMRDYPVDPARVYVAGLSAGGAAAIVMGAAHPDLYAAIGVHSGLAVGAARDVPSAFAAMHSGARGKHISSVPPTIVFHGLADTTVSVDNGRAVIDQVVKARSGVTHATEKLLSPDHRTTHVTRYRTPRGEFAELWEIEGAGHAWAGGDLAGSYTDPAGPDASRQMLRFFLEHRRS